VTLLAAVAAISLRNLVHSALMLAIAFSGMAALYLQLDAEFIGFTEILVYVGAIAILIVMAILLTRSGEAPEKSVLTHGWLAGVIVTVMVFAVLGWAVLASSALPSPASVAPHVTVKDIGDSLMTRYVLPLEIIGLVLTAAMIGAVVIAYKELAQSSTSSRGGRQVEPQSGIGNRQSTLRSTATEDGPAIGLVPLPAPAASSLKKEGAV
jgi:NADH-quinone oxidoreductase subunit J